MIERRDFLKYFAATCAVAPSFLTFVACSPTKEEKGFGILPSSRDELILAKGLEHEVLIKWQDQINSSESFGFNNDYTAFIPLEEGRGLLWVNHEYIDQLFVSGIKRGDKKTKEIVDNEMMEVGGSILEIKKSANTWSVVTGSKYNRRITGHTKIPFANGEVIQGRNYGVGTLGNCAGGFTPWGTVLTCEENYHIFYGEYSYDEKEFTPSMYGWEKFNKDNHSHQYGWVVEINPKTGEAKKHTSMGRCAHECATVTSAKNGRIVAYTGDDKVNEFLYRFVSDSNDSLDKGELFVADIKNGKWLSLDINKNPILKKSFKSQLDIQIHARRAGKLVGATPLDRPEDIEIHPTSGEVFVALTNNYNSRNMSDPNNRFYGKILKLSPRGGDHGADEFEAVDFFVGGEDTGLACPDNLVFDKLGNLWVTTDIAGSKMNSGPYKSFKNNGLFYIPLAGANAGKAFQLASAPRDAELTGITFSPDSKTLFMSVQHPGDSTRSLDNLKSNWPDGGDNIPRPAVIQVYGDLLAKLTNS